VQHVEEGPARPARPARPHPAHPDPVLAAAVLPASPQASAGCPLRHVRSRGCAPRAAAVSHPGTVPRPGAVLLKCLACRVPRGHVMVPVRGACPGKGVGDGEPAGGSVPCVANIRARYVWRGAKPGTCVGLVKIGQRAEVCILAAKRLGTATPTGRILNHRMARTLMCRAGARGERSTHCLFSTCSGGSFLILARTTDSLLQC